MVLLVVAEPRMRPDISESLGLMVRLEGVKEGIPEGIV
jgi:hypothetical protein